MYLFGPHKEEIVSLKQIQRGFQNRLYDDG